MHKKSRKASFLAETVNHTDDAVFRSFARCQIVLHVNNRNLHQECFVTKRTICSVSQYDAADTGSAEVNQM